MNDTKVPCLNRKDLKGRARDDKMNIYQPSGVGGALTGMGSVAVILKQ